MNITALIFSEYFHLRQTVPLVVYVFYARFRDVDHPIIDKLVKASMLAIGTGTIITITGCILGIPIKTLLSFTWTYPSPITWGIFFLTYCHILNRKGENNLASFTLATLATVGGGWLYEVPFFHPLSMFLSRGAFFYVNAQIICLLLLAHELMKRKFKPNKQIGATILLYFAFSIPLYINRYVFWITIREILGSLDHLLWFYRIPASLFLLSLLSGVKENV